MSAIEDERCSVWGEDARWWMRLLDRIRKGHARHTCRHPAGPGAHFGPHACRCKVAWS